MLQATTRCSCQASPPLIRFVFEYKKAAAS
nr:MAG TPA: hypothetical protein [Caudoviricetes sp.]